MNLLTEKRVTTDPPPLNRHSAEEFRQWLAEMVSPDKPSTATDRDKAKDALIRFLAVCPLVYSLDRLSMWEKIANAANAALDTCDGMLQVWVSDVLANIGAKAGFVAANDRLKSTMQALDGEEWWQAECLRTMRSLRFVIPVHARARWEELKEDIASDKQAAKNGDQHGNA